MAKAININLKQLKTSSYTPGSNRFGIKYSKKDIYI